MRRITSIALAAILSATGAMAADITPLAAGKPAGVRQAQMDWNISPLVYFGAVAVGIGIALAVSNNNNGGAPSTGGGSTTVSTSTTG
jgi:hypothetical protein